MNEFFDTLMAGPSCWPVKWRRAFLLTLPVSAQLYILSISAVFVGYIAFWLFLAVPFYAAQGAFHWLRDMWRMP